MKHRSIWAIATAEMRNSRRLMRTWIFIVVATFLVVSIYYNQSYVHAMASPISASVGDFGSRFLMGTASYAMLLVYEVGIIFFAFDIRARDTRDRIAGVLDSRPFTNVDLLLGRLSGLTLLLVIPATTVVVITWIVSFCLYYFGAVFGDVIEPYSVLSFLVLDLVPNLAFWGALTIFLSVLVRLRMIVAVLMIGLAIALFVMSTELPKYLLDPLAPVTALVIKPSDLAPEFMNGMILSQRFSLIVLVAGLLLLSAYLYPRLDGISKSWRLASGLSCLFVGVLIQSAVVMHSIKISSEFSRLADVHEAVSHLPRADIVHLSGEVHIDPGNDLIVDYRISFVTPDSNSEDHVFAFNPGFEIRSLELNGALASHQFEDGLLRLSRPKTLADGEQELTISARGAPDTAFGYFDAPLNAFDANALDYRALGSLGFRNGVNHKDYVALTPAIKWYPTAGSAYREDDHERSQRDQFTVDLEVTVPDGWIVAGPGSRETLQSTDETRFRFAPTATVPEIGLFGAQFVRRSMSVAGVEFELLVSPKHTRNVDLFADVVPVMKARIREIFTRAREHGIPYPYEMLSVVEVPASLRVYGGGWRMPSVHSFPGVFLIRETGFPIARFDARIEDINNTRTQETPVSELQWELLATYFESDLSGGNPFETIPRNFFNYQTSPTGKGASALAYVGEVLTSRLVTERTGFFSVYFIGSPAGRQSTEGTAIAASLGRTGALQVTDRLRDWVVNRPESWEFITSTALANIDFWSKPELTFNALTLKGMAVADSLFDALGEDDIGRLLSAIRARHRGDSFSSEDFHRIAGEMNIDTESIVGDWLNERELPGFQLFDPEIVRLPDDDLGVPVYQTTFYLTNEKPAPGLVKLSFDERGRDDPSPGSNSLPPIRIGASSALKVALHSEYPISFVRLHPYLSHNRDTLEIDVDVPDSWDPQNVERLPLLTPIELQATNDSSIVVDDLDEGFSVSGDSWSTPKTTLFHWFEENVTGRITSKDLHIDQGLPTWGYTSLLISQQHRHNWHRWSKRNSWGRFRRTTAIASPGLGSNAAHFEVSLPHSGRWQLEYHFPVDYEYRVGFETKRQLENVSMQTTIAEQLKAGTYSINIKDGERTIPIEFDVSIAPHGWNRLGQFTLEQRNIVVSVINRGEMRVYADAIRWTPTSRTD